MRPALLLALCTAIPAPLLAADGTWTRTNASSTTWGLATNWDGSQIADGVGATADFTAAQGGTGRTINIDGNDQTVGILNLRNQHTNGNGTQSFTFASTTGNALIFNNGGSAAQLNILAPDYNSGGTNTLGVGIRLGSSLNINNARPLAGNTLELSGAISASSAGLKTLTHQSTGPAQTTISGVISDGSGQVAVRQNSATSVLLLSGTNTYTGGTTIDAGRVTITADANLGAYTSTVTLNGGELRNTATINVTGSNQRNYVLGAGGGTFSTGGFMHVRGTIGGDGMLIKDGTSTLALYGAGNTYAGGTLIKQGTLRITTDSDLGAATGGVVFDGGTLSTNASIITSGERTATLNAGGGTFAALQFLNWNGVVSGSGLLTKTGANVFSLNNVNNTHSGGIQVSEGTIRFRNGDGSFGAAGNSVTLADATTFLIQDTFAAGSGRSLTLSSGNVGFDIRNNFTWQGAVAGGGDLTKIGEGDLVLAGVNTHTGATALNEGRLIVNGSIASAVTVASGATFGGNGSSSAALTLNAGGTLAAGHDGIGTFTTAAGLTLTSATYAVEFNSTLAAFDLTIAGDVTLGDAVLTLTDLGSGALTIGSTFTILENTGANSVAGAFLGLGEGATLAAGGHQFVISYLGGTGNDITLTVTGSPIPEPSAFAALAGLGALACGALRRRRTA